jgi:hypothetical protein
MLLFRRCVGAGAPIDPAVQIGPTLLSLPLISIGGLAIGFLAIGGGAIGIVLFRSRMLPCGCALLPRTAKAND